MPVKIDGILDEQQWVTADIISVKYHKPGIPSNTIVSVKMLWDEQYVYIGAESNDSNLIALHDTRDSHVWQDDCIELYFDTEIEENRHSLTYFEIDINPKNTIFDAFFVNYHDYSELNRIGPCEMVTGLKLDMKTCITIKGTINNSADIDDGWTLEMAIPANQLRTQNTDVIKPGYIWKANVYYHNVEDNREFMSWSPMLPDNSAHRPSTFGKIYFSF
jgi:hypothetical protein